MSGIQGLHSWMLWGDLDNGNGSAPIQVFPLSASLDPSQFQGGAGIATRAGDEGRKPLVWGDPASADMSVRSHRASLATPRMVLDVSTSSPTTGNRVAEPQHAAGSAGGVKSPSSRVRAQAEISPSPASRKRNVMFTGDTPRERSPGAGNTTVAGSEHAFSTTGDAVVEAPEMRTLATTVAVCGCNAFGQTGQDTALHRDAPEEQPLAFGELPAYLLHGHLDKQEDEDDWAPELAAVQIGEVRAVSVACGAGATACLTDAGAVYLWGDNSRGQLGRPLAAGECSHVPLRLPPLRPGQGPLLRRGRSGAARPALSVSMGGEHASAVTRSGQLFTWGDNIYGQLGFQQTRGGWVRVCAEPADVGTVGGWEGRQKFRAVSCGADFTACICDEEGGLDGEVEEQGVLYMFGRNDKAQCGAGLASANSAPVRPLLPPGRTVRIVACGGGHSLCVCAGGDVYGWGSNEHGQCGAGFSSR